MENSQRLRLRNRQILCRYGVGPDIADRVFDLQLAGWTSKQIAEVLEKAVSQLAA